MILKQLNGQEITDTELLEKVIAIFEITKRAVELGFVLQLEPARWLQLIAITEEITLVKKSKQ